MCFAGPDNIRLQDRPDAEIHLGVIRGSVILNPCPDPPLPSCPLRSRPNNRRDAAMMAVKAMTAIHSSGATPLFIGAVDHPPCPYGAPYANLFSAFIQSICVCNFMRFESGSHFLTEMWRSQVGHNVKVRLTRACSLPDPCNSAG